MDFLERVKTLCSQKKVSQRVMEKDIEISNGSSSKWNKSMPSADTLNKLSDYFGVSVEYLITGKEEDSEQKITSLSKSEELDIIEDVDVIMDKLNKGEDVVLRFNGAGAKDEGRELLRQSLLNTCRTAKLISKQKE